MASKYIFRQGVFGRMADALMTPLMYLLQGTVWEKPQRTHFWNNQKFHKSILTKHLNKPLGLGYGGDETAGKRKLLGFIPVFHIPIFGGWRNYVVLNAVGTDLDGWHIGWFAGDGDVGISKIPLTTPVRMLLGPDEVTFFAINSRGHQMSLHELGKGKIGVAGEFSHLPLL